MASLARAAHTLKGAIGNMAGYASFESALRLESAAQVGDPTETAKAYAELERQLKRIERDLSVLTQECVN
ncbi:MAG: Hpt domain-containing protein [Acidobacteria bacterium]|nr:Hpt domain-containing protein [Acidobacteriota bacterium]